jgi:Protein of unknown function (DUF1761)
MLPQLHINYLAMLAAVVLSFTFGWLWYGPIAGRKWAALMNLPADFKPDRKFMLRSMALQLLGTFLIAYVMAHGGEVWRASVWNAGVDEPFYVYGFFNAFFTWIGFFVPMLLGSVAWEGRPWALFGLNAAYHFINLQIIGMILAYWR